MPRLRQWTAAVLGSAAVMFLAAPSNGQDKKWVTVKGQIVWKGDAPEKKKPDVKTDKEHCLSKGELYYEDVQVDPKTKGVKNVWVYLKPAAGEEFAPGDLNPAFKGEPKQHVIDQPCCQFIPRILAARAGDTLLVKNSAPVPHNVNLTADEDQFNKTVPAGSEYKHDKPLKAQRGPILFKCDIHPWMAGRIMVFDHPYYALTDGEGRFEIKGAPEGKFRVFYRHENGYHMAKAGAKGFPVEIKAGADGTMEMKPVELELPKGN